MRPLARVISGAALGLALGACRSATEAPADSVVAHATSAGIVATNRSSRQAHYLAYEPGWLALVDLIPCSEVNDPCPRIQPGETVTIPWSQVGGYAPDSHLYRLRWSLIGTPPLSGVVDLPWPALL